MAITTGKDNGAFKVVLTQPRWLTERHIQPIGLMYLAAVLRARGYAVRVIDGEVEGHDTAQLARLIESERPDLVGVTATTAQVTSAFALAKMVKAARPGTFVIFGGAHPSSLPHRTMLEEPTLDAVAIGEGENTLIELVEHLQSRSSLDDVPGLLFRRGDELIQTASRKLIADLDTLPFPAWDLVPMERYVASTWFPAKVKQYVNVFTSRGCPYGCTFCAANAIWTRKFRARSPENVVAEIAEAVERLHIPNFFISDDLFTLKRQRVIDICTKILERNLKITWTCLSRVDTVDLEMLTLMKKAGCYLVTYGFESGSQQVLDTLKKGETIEESVKAVEMSRQAGLKVFGSFMIGSPGETPETVEATIRLIKRLKLDEVGLGVTTAYPGTELFKTWGKGVEKLDWDAAVAFNPSAADHSTVFVKCTDLDENQIRVLFRKALRETVLYSPRLIARRLAHLRSPRHLVHSLRAGFLLLMGN